MPSQVSLAYATHTYIHMQVFLEKYIEEAHHVEVQVCRHSLFVLL